MITYLLIKLLIAEAHDFGFSITLKWAESGIRQNLANLALSLIFISLYIPLSDTRWLWYLLLSWPTHPGYMSSISFLYRLYKPKYGWSDINVPDSLYLNSSSP